MGTLVDRPCRFGFQPRCQCCMPSRSSVSRRQQFTQWTWSNASQPGTLDTLVFGSPLDTYADADVGMVMSEPSQQKRLPDSMSLASVEFVDTHCHLDEVLQLFQRYIAVPSLIKTSDMLSEDEKRHWKVLGWLDTESDVSGEPGGDDAQDKACYDSDMGRKEDASNSSDTYKSTWMQVWDELTPLQQKAASSLGWDANSWNNNQWPLAKNTSWSNLTAEMQQSFELLGESKESWENWSAQEDNGASLNKKEVLERQWWQLTLEEKQAATALGFTKDTWDSTELADVNEVIGRYFRPEFVACVTQGCSEESMPFAQKLALSHEKVYVSFGCHPKAAWQYNDCMEKKLLTAAKACGGKTVAWGEFGLDYSHYYYGKIAENRRVQKEVFARQLELAIGHNFPLVIHSREAEYDTLLMLQHWVPRDWRVHLHSLRTSTMFLDTVLNGWSNVFVGLSGLVTMADAEIHKLCQHCPLDRILIETDAPYLPLNGSSFTHPGHVPLIAARIAELKGCDPYEVLRASRANAFRMYGI